MNKIISIILLCSLLLICLSSCALTDKIFGNNDNEPENPGVTPPENPGVTPPENPEGIVPEVPEGTEPENPDGTPPEDPGEEDKTPTELQADDERVVALLKRIEDFSSVCGYYIKNSLGDKINQIKSGRQALLLNYKSSDTYFVCGYYTEDYDEFFHFDAPEYTWVKFENANEITEEYKDLTLAIAFQFNKATIVSDIINEGADVPNVEHFQQFSPVFNESINTSDAIVFDKTYIYLTSSKKDNVYYDMSSWSYNSNSTIPFAYFNGEYYITLIHYTIASDGTRSDEYFVYEAEEYYDALLDVMIKDRYSETNNNGTVFYGLIKFEDFANLTNQNE